MKKIIGFTLIVVLAACGQEGTTPAAPAPTPLPEAPVATATPVPTVIPTATPTPTPNPTLVTYIFQNIFICNDLKTWNPVTTTIKTYNGPANDESYHYLFRYDGVKFIAPGGCEAGCAANAVLQRSNIHGVVCTITVTNGVLVSVTP